MVSSVNGKGVLQGKFLGHLLHKVTLRRAAFILSGVVYTTSCSSRGVIESLFKCRGGEIVPKAIRVFYVRVRVITVLPWVDLLMYNGRLLN